MATSETPRTAGLLLAAGAGRRMGRPKALIPHPATGRLLVESAAAALRASGCDPVLVVLGASAELVRARADLSAYQLVDNAEWESGMGSSLRTGLAALASAAQTGAGADAVLVSLVDQPGIGAAAMSRVLAARAAGATLAAAAYGGRRGHPVLLPAVHWAAVAASATGDRGARDFLRAHAADLTEVDCTDLGDPADLDTPEDLRRLAAPGAVDFTTEA